MIDTEFDFDIVCLGGSWDKQDCVDDDGHNMVRYFRMDMLMLRASPVMLNEWFANRESMDVNDFETMAEWDHYIDDKEAAQLAWNNFCNVNTDGSAASNLASLSRGFAPCFCV